jgi:hypothetical protein
MSSWFKSSEQPSRIVKRAVQQPSRFVRGAAQRPGRIVEKAAAGLQPKRSGVPVGLIVGPAIGAVALFAFAWFLPELVRYVKIEMM